MKNTKYLIALIAVSSASWASEEALCPLALKASTPAEVPAEFVLVGPKAADGKYRLVNVEFSKWHPEKRAIIAPLGGSSSAGSSFAHYQFGFGATDLWITCTYRRETVVMKVARPLRSVASCAVETRGSFVVGVQCPDEKGIEGPAHVK